VPLVWQRPCRRGASGEPGLTSPDVAGDLVAPGELLRPALELAWAIANVDQRAVPPVLPPRQLRPLMRFAKLPDRALATVRRVLEEDETFRERVARAATAAESELGRASFLWLVRPDGWEEELAGLGAVAQATAATAREDQEERSARRRLVAATDARVRAEQAAAAAQASAVRAGDELASERQARRAAEIRIAELERSIAQLGGRAGAAEQSVATLEEALAKARAGEAVLQAERDGLAGLVAELEHDLASARGRLADVDVAASESQGDLARAIADAAAGARALGTALTAAATSLSGESPTDAVLTGSVTEVAPSVAASLGRPEATATRLRPSSRASGPRRRATPLPPAMFDDSSEASEHLVRVPGTVLLVDGYNVSLRAWPDLAIPEQRRRLTDALAELAARTGVDAQLVFDGAEQPGACAPTGTPRSAVRVRFSPPDVDADEVLIELVDQLPLHRPIVVATSDRRVQNEVRSRGANVISTSQLLGLLGRAR
jgi:predicted RNA-binding protein with PIN domain